MPDNVLLSGPAGAGKSQIARGLLADYAGAAVAVDFQSIVVSLLLLQRGADGKFPVRPNWVLPTAEYLRRTAITAARDRDIRIFATNSDGDPKRRAFLLGELGEGATERIIDPGENVVRARLSNPATGELDAECEQAIGRWYARLGL